jgi:hypothetical protein
MPTVRVAPALTNPRSASNEGALRISAPERRHQQVTNETFAQESSPRSWRPIPHLIMAGSNEAPEERIAAAFNGYFANFDILIEPVDAAVGSRREIRKRGWWIAYRVLPDDAGFPAWSSTRPIE